MMTMPFRSRMLTLKDCDVRVGRLNKEVVKSLWANLSLGIFSVYFWIKFSIYFFRAAVSDQWWWGEVQHPGGGAAPEEPDCAGRGPAPGILHILLNTQCYDDMMTSWWLELTQAFYPKQQKLRQKMLVVISQHLQVTNRAIKYAILQFQTSTT